MEDIEIAARKLCYEDGENPDLVVGHTFGDDFTAEEIESMEPAGEVDGLISSAQWRLYRPRAAAELARQRRLIKGVANVEVLRRRGGD